MKVLVSVDIEGIAGVFHREQTRPGNGKYEQARRWMTREANAAALGALEDGASQVWINDFRTAAFATSCPTCSIRTCGSCWASRARSA